ncbi:hypothetical protein GCM10010095_54010 [Streptomyces anthocyanicus]|uniref:Uncharacterized protein n=1 Tax=Streptomyces violaceolatus TaxID=67378 RepID=A0ABN3T9L4_9ACTN|nr:hypothetical protein GCM10010095_54010 [Streptomyces anthocyanicus]
MHREQHDCLGGGGDRELTDDYLVGDEQFLTEAASTGRRPTRDERDSRRALGERAADAGHGLRLPVSEHLAAAPAIWPRFSSPTNSALAVRHQETARRESHRNAFARVRLRAYGRLPTST